MTNITSVLKGLSYVRSFFILCICHRQYWYEHVYLSSYSVLLGNAMNSTHAVLMLNCKLTANCTVAQTLTNGTVTKDEL